MRILRTRTCALLTGALLLTGCSDLPGDYYATDVDVRRAQQVWSDPWVAPSQLTVPRAAYGSNGQVDRLAGGRTTTYRALGSVPATRAEVTSAQAAGWQLVGATCDDGDVRAVLTRGGSDLDTAVVAEVVAEDDTTSQAVTLTRVDVTADVPHHLDDDWPDLGPPVELGQTCLAGGKDHPAPELPDDDPRGPVDDGVDAPEWTSDGPSAADRARMEALQADPWFASLGVGDLDPDTDEGDQSRHAPSASGDLTPGPRAPTAALAAVLGDMEGWQVTYVACSPYTGAVATARMETDDGPIVARLDALPGTDGAVSWTVTLPIVGAPEQSWVDQTPALEDPACLASTRLRQPIVEGTPVGLPDELQPLQ